jgi:hypothetical protein
MIMVLTAWAAGLNDRVRVGDSIEWEEHLEHPGTKGVQPMMARLGGDMWMVEYERMNRSGNHKWFF